MSWSKKHLPLVTAIVSFIVVVGCATKTSSPAPVVESTPIVEGLAEVSLGELPPVVSLPAELPPAEFRPGFIIETEELAGELGWSDTSTKLSTSLVIIDGRLPEEYQTGHIPGAINLHWTEVRDYEAIVQTGLHLTPERAEEVFGRAGIDAQTRVVVYDDGAGRNANGLAFVLYLFGHEQAQMLNGGFRKWVTEGRPVSGEIARVEKKNFVARPRTDLTVTLAWLVENKDRADVLIVDPRDFGEYVGFDTIAAWPDNARAGYIPDALSFPWTDLGGELKTFASPEMMQYLLTEAGVTRDKEIITYCNPGIGRSTFMWLALKILGYKNVRVFSGSFEEWSKHTELVVGTVE